MAKVELWRTFSKGSRQPDSLRERGRTSSWAGWLLGRLVSSCRGYPLDLLAQMASIRVMENCMASYCW